MNIASRIALGTAQFGLDYGIANRSGQASTEAARTLLDHARSLGIGWLDTAAAYGSAETVLGRLVGGDPTFSICTKVLAATEVADPVDRAQAQFDASLARLRRNHVDILMIHDARQLLDADGERVYRWLAGQRESGRTGAIGVSVYEGTTARALRARFQLDWIQLPLNVLDQRCVRDGTLAALKAAGTRIQARSALLQGLLLAEPGQLPDALSAAAKPLARLRAAAAAGGVSPLQVALGFVASITEVDLIVLGVESAQQLDECLAGLQTTIDPGWPELAIDEIIVTDPRRWPSGLRLAA